MRIPYRVFPDSYGPPGSSLYSATLAVQIAHPAPGAPRTKRFEVIIDSGATRTLFHANLAPHLGLDLKSGEIEMTQGIAGGVPIYLHEISLYLPGGPVKVKAGFRDNLPVAGLLGMNGFFEYFRVTFDPDLKACEIQRIHRA